MKRDTYFYPLYPFRGHGDYDKWFIDNSAKESFDGVHPAWFICRFWLLWCYAPILKIHFSLLLCRIHVTFCIPSYSDSVICTYFWLLDSTVEEIRVARNVNPPRLERPQVSLAHLTRIEPEKLVHLRTTWTAEPHERPHLCHLRVMIMQTEGVHEASHDHLWY